MLTCRTSCLSAALILAAAGALALAQPPKDAPKATPPMPKATTPPPAPGKDAAKPGEHAMTPPPGMSEADMQACMEAATPGPMHEHLAKSVGVWAGKNKMWMTPDGPPMESECISTITSMMDGRFTKCESVGDAGGMPFNGFGLYGYDNVSKTFQSTWVDNMGTGMMTGTGELSADGKVMTWTMHGTCPMTRKPIVVREIDRTTGPDTMTMEMYGPEPKTGKEFKMMEISFTRKAGSGMSAPRRTPAIPATPATATPPGGAKK